MRYYSPRSRHDAAGREVYVAERTRNLLVNSDVGGRLLSAVMLPWFRSWPPRGWGVLTTVGRKTGKPRPKCIRAVRRGDKAYLVAIRPGAAWLSNARANPHVRLRLHDGEVAGIVREPAGAERDEARTVFCGTIHLFDYVGCLQHRRGLPRRAKVQQLHEFWFDQGVPLVIELGSASRSAARQEQ